MIRESNCSNDFKERLKQKREGIVFPRDVIFEITYRCNLRCRHCYVVPEAKRKELATLEIKSIFKQLVEIDCQHLTLTGGEPLAREDLFSLISYAKKIGLSIHLFTNGSLITSKIADRLKEFELASLGISFHSLKKKRFDWFTQVDGSFDSVVRAIKLLKLRKVKFSLKVNLTKLNIDEIKELRKFAESLGVESVWSTLLRPRLNGSKDNLMFRLAPEEAKEVEDRLSKPINKEDLPFLDTQHDREVEINWIKDRLFQCGASKSSFNITPYGELKPCFILPSWGYYILDGDLKERWQTLKDNVSSMKPSSNYKCFDCKLRDFCVSCPARAMYECGDMSSCPEYFRRLAELDIIANEHTKPRI